MRPTELAIIVPGREGSKALLCCILGTPSQIRPHSFHISFSPTRLLCFPMTAVKREFSERCYSRLGTATFFAADWMNWDHAGMGDYVEMKQNDRR